MAANLAKIVDDLSALTVIEAAELAKLLEEQSLEVDSAETAEQAIDYLSQHRPDVIFMDHLMPGMDGFQAVQAIKSNPRTATIPILMYTSQEGELYLGQARALGAAGVLPKSVAPADVRTVLQQLHLVDQPEPATVAAQPEVLDAAVAVANTVETAALPPMPEQNVEGVREEILAPVLPAKLLHKGTKYHINPTGKFIIGGPVGDCGLTGRKIIVDTYGGWARHGGGAFSGKDPSKVDRSAAYAARYVAKNVVAAGLADRCEVQVSYAIGVAEPTSISVTTFGTGKIPDAQIEKLIRGHFDLRPYGITKMLDLLHPIYQRTASYGHFGRKPQEVSYVDAHGKSHTATAFSWEKTDVAEALRKAAKLK